MMIKKTGFARIISAFKNSSNGFLFLVRNESAFRQEALALIVMIPCAYFLSINAIEFILLVAFPVFVIIVEIINTAIEATIDRVGTEYHELSGLAKDLGSAAVLMSLVLTFFVWAVIVWKNILSVYG